jgi:uncharacterized protein
VNNPRHSQTQTIVWEARKWSSMEYLRLEERADEITADGTIVMIDDDSHLPLRIHYAIRCDSAWAVRQAAIQVEGYPGPRQRLQADGAGHWTRSPGRPLAALDGCIDVDIAATPFTNTLPIRRLKLKPNESAEIEVVYITIPELAFSAAKQRYTCLEMRSDGGRYRYESLDSGFTAELTVDANGLVIDYAELWRRLWPR